MFFFHFYFNFLYVFGTKDTHSSQFLENEQEIILFL